MSSRRSQPVVAWALSAQQLQAAEVRRTGGGYEVLALHETSLERDSWEAFADRCGLRWTPGEGVASQHGRSVVLGISAVGVTSMRLTLPEVAAAQLDDMVRLQTETRLPLPLDQMEVGWRRVTQPGEQAVVTVAAARRARLHGLLQQSRPLGATSIFVDAEGLVALSGVLTTEVPGEAVLVDLDEHVTTVCRIEAGQLSQVAIVDCGRADLVDGAGTATESLARDLQRVVQEVAPKWPLVLLSEGGEVETALAESLAGQGLAVTVATLDPERLRLREEGGAEALWRARRAVGLAVAALADDGSRGLFDHLVGVQEVQEARGPICSLRMAVLGLVLALVALGAATEMATRLRVAQLRRLQASGQVAERVRERQLQRTLAQYRTDLLDLLTQVNDESFKEITIDGVDAERGKPVRISGHTKKAEAMYAFEEGLLKRPGISTARLEKQSYDQKTKVYGFSLLLDYKTFTRRSIRRPGDLR